MIAVFCLVLAVIDIALAIYFDNLVLLALGLVLIILCAYRWFLLESDK